MSFMELPETGQTIFLHKLVEGVSKCSYGIQVARLAGIPATILTKAAEKSSELQQTVHRAKLLKDFATLVQSLHNKDESLTLVQRLQDLQKRVTKDAI
jgi:DNA mismatch repair ATPase MutS